MSLNTRGPSIRIAKLNKQIKELRKALEFYAAEKTYQADPIADIRTGVPHSWLIPITNDKGKIAREALRQ